MSQRFFTIGNLTGIKDKNGTEEHGANQVKLPAGIGFTETNAAEIGFLELLRGADELPLRIVRRWGFSIRKRR